ncbi:ketoacyl-ACP synthase III [Streptomyces sp. NBC_01283]|uniref:3-oxoacyl-[acyl-carrier-protein] synthase III C-terminal domain-containing protein n=1 Tax=Streptomyces sp. NBC_01283 TaxID=2903812 RepID=UPI00352C2BF7|nr:ketoacyl-ACP synthase III [Streptomyces sp. NBC_01283]WSL21322.1 ketoacyl-ACP synthase III [Streptomyces sp. NBC_01283]
MFVGWGSRHAQIRSVAGYHPHRAIVPAALSGAYAAQGDQARRPAAGTDGPPPGTEESLASMGARAAADAAARVGVDTDDVDCVLVASLSKRDQRQHLAHAVADRLEGTPRAALDVDATSGGFCSALELGRCLVSASTYDRVLVVGAERAHDTGTAEAAGTTGLHSAAGGGAVLLEAGDEPGICTPAWGEGATPAQVARAAVKRAGLRTQDIRALVSHRHPDGRVRREAATLLSLARDVTVAHDACLSGSASIASIPMAIATLLAEFPALSGELALLVGFGAELSLAAQVVRLP